MVVLHGFFTGNPWENAFSAASVPREIVKTDISSQNPNVCIHESLVQPHFRPELASRADVNQVRSPAIMTNRLKTVDNCFPQKPDGFIMSNSPVCPAGENHGHILVLHACGEEFVEDRENHHVAGSQPSSVINHDCNFALRFRDLSESLGTKGLL